MPTDNPPRAHTGAVIDRARRQLSPGMTVAASSAGLLLVAVVGWVAWNQGALVGLRWVEFDEPLTLAALGFVAGIGAFFAPCAFALFPGYISYYLTSTGTGRETPAHSLGLGLTCAAGSALFFALAGAVITLVGGAVSPYLIAAKPAIAAAVVLLGVVLPAELSGRSPSAYRGRAEALLSLVGLRDFRDKLPRELSGGMQQRASLCRALLLDPPLLLMDEPFGALDAMTRDEMNLELLRIWGQAREAGGERKTIVFVTHSISEAVLLADRVVVMTPRPGRVAEAFAVPLPRPRTIATRAQPQFGALCLAIHETLVKSPDRP